MKTMTCRQLGGACNEKFHAETFDEIARQSREHGMKMMQQGEEKHLEAMNKMKEVMVSQEAMNAYMENKRREFEALPDNI